MSAMAKGSPFEHIIEDIEGNVLDREQKMVLAKGFIPLDPEVLATALLLLTNDSDRQISESARETILDMPVNIVKNIAQNRKTSPKLIYILSRLRIADAEILEAIVLNPMVNNDTLDYIALNGPGKVVEILAGNQERMLSHDSILHSLMKNPNTPAYIQTRLETFKREMSEQKEAKLAEARKQKEIAQKREAQHVQVEKKDAPGSGAPEMVRPKAAPVVKPKPKPVVAQAKPHLDEEAGEEIELFEEDETRSQESANASQRIAAMNVAERIKLAKLGSREERMILIRETNKQVALAAVTSPKTTDDEYEQIARMKNVIEEVLREIGYNRERTQNPAIRRALLENPRTPVGVSLNLVKMVTEKELRDLAKNRNIPETIRTTAKRMVIQRQQRKEKKSGGH